MKVGSRGRGRKELGSLDEEEEDDDDERAGEVGVSSLCAIVDPPP